MTSLIFPFHDPDNVESKFLKQVLPLLKENFDKAFVSVTPRTVDMNPQALDFLKGDSFFVVNENTRDSSIGDHLLAGYKNAIEHSKPDDILHLCYTDRMVYALLNYKEYFLGDVNQIYKVPTLFVRSAKAWATHPINYYAAESMVTAVGKSLFNQTFDFCWCYLSMSAKQLDDILPNLTAKDWVIASQVILSLKNILITKEVDWLSWEDPFIFNKNAQEYKLERENSSEELDKRMSYVLPQIRYLFEEYQKIKIIKTEDK